MIRTPILVAVLLLLVAGGAAPLHGQDLPQGELSAQERAAQAAAEDWLTILSDGDYERSWDAASEQFQAAVTPDSWAQQAGMLTGQLGDLRRRRLAGAQYTTELPNAPEGEYVLLTYSSEYANLPAAQELVAMVLEDGEWRVAGYFVRPAQGT